MEKLVLMSVIPTCISIMRKVSLKTANHLATLLILAFCLLLASCSSKIRVDESDFFIDLNQDDTISNDEKRPDNIRLIDTKGIGVITFDWSSVGLYQNGVGDEKEFNHRYTPNSRKTEDLNRIRYIIYVVNRNNVGRGWNSTIIVEINVRIIDRTTGAQISYQSFRGRADGKRVSNIEINKWIRSKLP